MNKQEPEKDSKVDRVDTSPKVVSVEKLELSEPVSKELKRPEEQKAAERQPEPRVPAERPRSSKALSEISSINQRVASEQPEPLELRIPTQKSEKQPTEPEEPDPEPEPISEYKEEESYYQHMRALEEQKEAESRAQQRAQETKQRQQDLERSKEEYEKLRKALEEQEKEEKIVKYRGVVKDILGMANYTVYQEIIEEANLGKYLREYEKMGSADTQTINKFDLEESLKLAESEPSYHVLIAKDSHSLEKGIGLFRKSASGYLCDHLTTHQLNTLTEVALSLCRYIFLHDPGCSRVEFEFDFDRADYEHANIYQSLEQLCMDYGEVYQVRGEVLKRKYVVKRALFVDGGEPVLAADTEAKDPEMKIDFNTTLYVGERGAITKRSQ